VPHVQHLLWYPHVWVWRCRVEHVIKYMDETKYVKEDLVALLRHRCNQGRRWDPSVGERWENRQQWGDEDNGQWQRSGGIGRRRSDGGGLVVVVVRDRVLGMGGARVLDALGQPPSYRRPSPTCPNRLGGVWVLPKLLSSQTDLGRRWSPRWTPPFQANLEEESS
jgi:hypothetical protein